MENKSLPPLTTYEVSRYLHVDLTTVINWCDQKKLIAYKTPGGHRRVQPESFLQFLKEFNMPMPPEFLAKIKGSIRILVVDDESEVRAVIRKTLKKRLVGSEIFEAVDGFEAGKMVLDKMPNLVVLDLMLPGMDGFKVCADIRGDERFKETKILAITAQETADNKRKIMQAGADDFLGKPFEINVFMDRVYKLLDISPSEKEAEK